MWRPETFPLMKSCLFRTPCLYNICQSWKKNRCGIKTLLSIFYFHWMLLSFHLTAGYSHMVILIQFTILFILLLTILLYSYQYKPMLSYIYFSLPHITISHWCIYFSFFAMSGPRHITRKYPNASSIFLFLCGLRMTRWVIPLHLICS